MPPKGAKNSSGPRSPRSGPRSGARGGARGGPRSRSKPINTGSLASLLTLDGTRNTLVPLSASYSNTISPPSLTYSSNTLSGSYPSVP